MSHINLDEALTSVIVVILSSID